MCAETLDKDWEEEVVERKRFREKRIGLGSGAEGGFGNGKQLRVPVVEDVLFN